MIVALPKDAIDVTEALRRRGNADRLLLNDEVRAELAGLDI